MVYCVILQPEASAASVKESGGAAARGPIKNPAAVTGAKEADNARVEFPRVPLIATLYSGTVYEPW